MVAVGKSINHFCLCSILNVYLLWRKDTRKLEPVSVTHYGIPNKLKNFIIVLFICIPPLVTQSEYCTKANLFSVLVKKDYAKADK